MESQFVYSVATDDELNELIAGRKVGIPIPWNGRQRNLRVPSGETGVVWKDDIRPGAVAQPLVIVSREEDQRRLCGRIAQLQSDLAPLTAWCHLLTPQRFEMLDSLVRDADLGGYQAAWTGLVVAEALLLAMRPVSNIRIAACVATQSFAVARALALWGDRVPLAEVVERFDTAQRLLRSGEPNLLRLRTALQVIWAVLGSAATGQQFPPGASELGTIVASVKQLQDARLAGSKSEARDLAEPLSNIVPEVDGFVRLAELSPEQRLQQFDQLIECVEAEDGQHDPRRHMALTLLAGYLATIAAGGAPSLALTNRSARRWPEITAWAYVLGGIGERVVWTSSFDGLGRLVARELMRPLRLDEAPACDFALDEARFLVDPQLADPFVHLRIKQGRIISVALLPGVNVSVPITGVTSQEQQKVEPTQPNLPPETRSLPMSSGDVLVNLADALWPHIQDRVAAAVSARMSGDVSARGNNKPQRSRGKQKGASQSGLPLRDPSKPWRRN